jgi:hypothetical protein
MKGRFNSLLHACPYQPKVCSPFQSTLHASFFTRLSIPLHFLATPAQCFFPLVRKQRLLWTQPSARLPSLLPENAERDSFAQALKCHVASRMQKPTELPQRSRFSSQLHGRHSEPNQDAQTCLAGKWLRFFCYLCALSSHLPSFVELRFQTSKP